MSKIDIIISGPDALKQEGYFLNGRRPELRDFAITLSFRLGALPELGALTLTSKSFAFASQLVQDEVRERLEEIDGPASATLETVDVSSTPKNGERASEAVSYSHPVLKIIGPAA
ncbi:hypothetical protein ACIQF8_20290 [Pseudarthrobacter sp. NPDC092184]|uniref:hypothetical protein n=1 Tax=unclassified Pseudarthrobacter TaxID=2647000 RepID=UPI003822490D